MTFTRQLRLTRVFIGLLGTAAVSVGTALGAALLVGHYWLALCALVVVLLGTGRLIYLNWSLLRRQRSVAQLGDQLREISGQIPSGTARFYASHDRASGGIQCNPRWRGADHFSLVELNDFEDVERALSGERVHLPVVTYRVERAMPLIWRDVWADEAVKGAADGLYHQAGRKRKRSRLTQRWSSFMLNHKTGVLVPDPDELAEVFHIMKNADRTWDLPA